MTNQRSKTRIALTAPGKLSEPFAGKHGVDLLDISSGGARIATFRTFPVGQSLYLSIDGMQPVRCEVRWTKPGEIGVVFERDLHVAVVDHLAANHRTDA